MNNENIYSDKKINNFILDIMKQNNVEFVCLSPAHHHSGSVEQRMINAVEDATRHIPNIEIEQTNYNTGGNIRFISHKELMNEWHLRRLEFQLSFKQMFEQEYLLDNSYIKAEQNRLDQRHLSLEEFKKEEILSRNRPKNDWFRNKHEKKRFIKGL